jgi:hypothetical protein
VLRRGLAAGFRRARSLCVCSLTLRGHVCAEGFDVGACSPWSMGARSGSPSLCPQQPRTPCMFEREREKKTRECQASVRAE